MRYSRSSGGLVQIHVPQNILPVILPSPTILKSSQKPWLSKPWLTMGFTHMWDHTLPYNGVFNNGAQDYRITKSSRNNSPVSSEWPSSPHQGRPQQHLPGPGKELQSPQLQNFSGHSRQGKPLTCAPDFPLTCALPSLANLTAYFPLTGAPASLFSRHLRTHTLTSSQQSHDQHAKSLINCCPLCNDQHAKSIFKSSPSPAYKAMGYIVATC